MQARVSEKVSSKYLQQGEVTQIAPRIKKIAGQIPGEGKEFIENIFHCLEKKWFLQISS